MLFRAMLPGPHANAQLTGVPVIMLAGKLDPMIPQRSSADLQHVFLEAGADAIIHWEPTGHGLTYTDVEVAKSWLASRTKS